MLSYPTTKKLKHQQLPVSASHFPPIKLSKQEVGKCEDFAKTKLSSFLKSEYEERMGTSKVKWHHLGDKNGVSSYMRNGSVRCSWHFKFQATVQGTVRDILDGLYSDNTEEFRDMCEHVHEDKLADCSVLGVLKNREEDDNNCFKFLGFKWKGFAPLTSHVEARDYCLLEYSGITTDIAGGELGFRIFESVKIPECPSQYNTLGFVRGRMSRCCLYRDRPEGGMVQVLVLGYYDPNAVCTEWKNNRNALIQKSMINLAACVVNIPTCIEAKTISSRLFLPKSEWVENKHRKTCFLCQKKFNIIRHRHHCRVCGEIMCRNCSIQKTFRQFKKGITQVEYIRVCKSCKGNAKNAPPKKYNSSTDTIGEDLFDKALSEDDQMSYKSSQSLSDDFLKDGVFTPACNSSVDERMYLRSSTVDSEDFLDHDIKKVKSVGSSSIDLWSKGQNIANLSSNHPSVCSNPEGLRSFHKINKTLAEQEMLLDAMKTAASDYSHMSSKSVNSKRLNEDPTRFEVLNN